MSLSIASGLSAPPPSVLNNGDSGRGSQSVDNKTSRSGRKSASESSRVPNSSQQSNVSENESLSPVGPSGPSSGQSRNSVPGSDSVSANPLFEQETNRPLSSEGSSSKGGQPKGDAQSSPLFSNDNATRTLSGEKLDRQQQKEVEKLKKRSKKVKKHEQAHLAAGGRFVRGGINYEYKRGPDGKRYVVDGSVKLEAGKSDDPRKTISKMRQLRSAALAPAQPSPQDLQVAQKASRKAQEARKAMQGERQQEVEEKQQEIRNDTSGSNGDSGQSNQGQPQETVQSSQKPRQTNRNIGVGPDTTQRPQSTGGESNSEENQQVDGDQANRTVRNSVQQQVSENRRAREVSTENVSQDNRNQPPKTSQNNQSSNANSNESNAPEIDEASGSNIQKIAELEGEVVKLDAGGDRSEVAQSEDDTVTLESGGYLDIKA